MATRYVTKHGSASDSNGGTNATTDAWATAIKGFSSISGGDTLKFGTGTYDIDRSSLYTPIPSGSSGSPTIITDNADGVVTFHHPGSGFSGMIFFGAPSVATRTPTPQYISIIGTSPNNIVFDAEDQAACLSAIYLGWTAVNNLRLENVYVANSVADGIAGVVTNLTLKTCYLYHNGSGETDGTPHTHGVYVTGPNFIVDGCTFDTNHGWGLHCYNSGSNAYTGVQVINNRAFNNGFGDGSAIGDGLFVEEGSALIANNVSYKNGGSGIRIWRTSNTNIYHNTCDQNTLYGINVGRSSGTTSNTNIKNNICIDNGTSPILIQASCTGTVATWNRLGSGESINSSGDSGGTYNNNTASGVDTDEWVDPNNATLASRDYNLKAGADSIWDASTNNVPSVGVTTDIEGTPRVHPDQGAYAFGTPDPPDPPVIGHNTVYTVTAWTLTDIPLTLFDNDSNTKNLSLDGSTDGVSIEFGDTTNCTVT